MPSVSVSNIYWMKQSLLLVLYITSWCLDIRHTTYMPLIGYIWIQINEANAERNGKSNITPCVKEAHILKTIIVSNSTPFLKKKNYEQKKIWISIALNFQRRIDLLEIADKVILGQEIYIYKIWHCFIFLYRITLSAIEVQGSRIPGGFSVKHSFIRDSLIISIFYLLGTNGFFVVHCLMHNRSCSVVHCLVSTSEKPHCGEQETHPPKSPTPKKKKFPSAQPLHTVGENLVQFFIIL